MKAPRASRASQRLDGAARGGRAWRRVVVLLVLVASVASVVAWSPGRAAARSAALTRYPYVSEVVGNSATLNWATDTSQSTGSATWGAVSGGSCTPTNSVTAHPIAITVGSTAEYQWSVPLSFPSPGTYCYRVQLAGVDLLGTDPSPQVSTAAAPGTPFSFAVLGDYGAGTTGEAAVMSRIGASPASFVVTAGDNVYNSGTETEYGDLSQGNLFPSQYLPALGGKPIFASEGNHGFSINTPYVQDFAAPLAAAASGGSDVSESYCCISTLSGAHTYPSVWYAYNWGSARFYVLDGAWADTQGAYQGDFLGHWNGPVSGCGPCGAELTWLKSDLAAHASTPIKFAFFHYPLHADSSGQGTDTYLDGPTGLEGLLANNNVQIAFNGHAHQYERNYPQIPGKPLVTYVDGNGGDALGSVGGCSAFDAYAIGSGSSCHAPTPASDANVYGFVLVTVNGSQVTVTPTDSTGRTYDVQTYNYAPANDFSIGASPTSATVTAGSSTAPTISTAVTSGSTQSVALSATGAPSGASVSFSPQTLNAGQSSTMTVTTSSTTPTGTFPITVTGTGASATHTTTFSLTVNPAPVAPTITSTNNATFTVGSPGSFTVNTTGVPTPVITESGPLPNGVGFVDNGNGTATLSGTPATGTAASYPVTIGASNGVGTPASQSFTLTVDAPVPNDFSIGASPTSATVTAGSSTAPSISTAVTSGSTQSVALSATGAPSGALVSFSPQTLNAGQSSTMTVTTSSTTPTGTFPITVTGTGASATHTTTFSLTVNPAPPNDFSIGASPTSATVTAGSSTAPTISTAVTSGSTQSVALSATGAPSGALVSFSPQTLNAGQSSTMTVTTSSTTPTGTFPITVTGTGASATHSTTFSLTVNPVPPGPVFVQSAGSTTKTVTLPAPSASGDLLVLTAGVYTGNTHPITAVSDGKNVWTKVGAYDVSGKNSDGEMWYAPNAAPVSSVTVTTSASTVALRVMEFSGVATSAPLDGSTGTAGTGKSASSGTATPLGSNDLAVGFVAGHNNTQAITVTSPGYTVPAQVAATSPNKVTVAGGYQDFGAPGPQSYGGTFGTTMYWAAGIALFKSGTPPPPPNDFSIGASPTSATVTAGSSTAPTISTAVTSGSTQSVALSATGAPSGASVSFSPQTLNAGQSSTMTVTTSSTTPTGTFPITVTGTGASATHTTTFSLTVNPAPVAPTITSTNSATFTVGSPGSFTVNTTGVPTPAITESGPLPNGVGFVDNGNGTATLSGTPATGTATSYPITIGASNGVGTPASQSFTLTVDAPVPNDFSIGASPTSATVTAGSSTAPSISTAVTSGSTQSVALSATGAPSGALVSFSPQTLNAGQSSTMTVTTSSTTPTGTFPITVTGTGASATHSTTFSLTVNPAPPNDFSIGASPTSATVTAGSSTAPSISTAVTSGSTQSVALSATGAPSGALVSFSPQTLNAGQSSTMTVTTSSTTPTGTFPITVTGTGASATHTTTFSLTVNPVPSGPVLVQTASGTETAAASTLSGTFPAATGAGDLLVLSASVYTGATNHITSVTDSAGNTWNRVGAYDASGHYSDGELWYSANAKPTNMVTAHTGSAAFMAFEVLDFSGVATTAPLDTSNGTSNTGTSASSGTAASSVANELAVGFVAGHGNTQTITVTSPGYTAQSQQNTTGTVATVVTGYQVLGTPGAQSFAGTFASGMYWAAGIAVFKP